MANLKIPKPYDDGFLLMVQMTQDAFDSLLKALSTPPEALTDSPTLVETIATEIPTIPRDHAKKILNSILPLFKARRNLSESIPEFVETVQRSLAKVTSQKKKEKEILAERLTKIFEVTQFENWSKADDLLHDHEHVFHEVRVFSDIRPVFGSEVDEGIAGGVIVHTIRLTYSERGQAKDFYIAVDSRDLINIIDVLIRARKKMELMQELLTKSELRIYNVE